MKKRFATFLALASMFGGMASLSHSIHTKEQAIIQQPTRKTHRKKKGLLANGDETPGAPEYDRLDFWRHTKRQSYRAIQRTAAKRKKQLAKSHK
jgi:predicted alpha/beta superfamily hydrolase